LLGHRIFLDLSILLLAEQDSIPSITPMNLLQATKILLVFQKARYRTLTPALNEKSVVSPGWEMIAVCDSREWSADR
jgi:hypothetical protein